MASFAFVRHHRRSMQDHWPTVAEKKGYTKQYILGKVYMEGGLKL